jgi:transposase
MLEPEVVTTMLRLRQLGWGTRRLAREFGCSRNTVKGYVTAGGWRGFQTPQRSKKLAGREDWLRASFLRHRGNAEVVRQELAQAKGITVSLRTVERAVAPYRQQLRAEARACVRFETPPGQQLQIDFGETRVMIAGEPVKVHLFVATLGYSRRCYVQAFDHERQAAWLAGLEGAFAHFGGVPAQVLIDNPKALVTRHDVATREVEFNERFHAFARYWGFRPQACAPFRARTKGKDERGVGYVKRNAIAGRRFDSWAALEAHLLWWMREVADRRVHGTTGETPLARFQRAEVQALRPLAGRPPFEPRRELVRKVMSDCAVEVDTNAYSVPWRLIGERVQVEVIGGRVRVCHAGQVVAEHAQSPGRHQRIVEPAHFEGVAGHSGAIRASVAAAMPPATAAPALLRPLAEYEQIAGGGW